MVAAAGRGFGSRRRSGMRRYSNTIALVPRHGCARFAHAEERHCRDTSNQQLVFPRTVGSPNAVSSRCRRTRSWPAKSTTATAACVWSMATARRLAKSRARSAMPTLRICIPIFRALSCCRCRIARGGHVARRAAAQSGPSSRRAGQWLSRVSRAGRAVTTPGGPCRGTTLRRGTTALSTHFPRSRRHASRPVHATGGGRQRRRSTANPDLLRSLEGIA